MKKILKNILIILSILLMKKRAIKFGIIENIYDLLLLKIIQRLFFLTNK